MSHSLGGRLALIDHEVVIPALSAYYASRSPMLESTMTLCPIAIVSGCEKCPAFKICPLKGVIGDYKPKEEAKSGKPTASAPPKK